MKLIRLVSLFIMSMLLGQQAGASHLAGGNIAYTFVGMTPNGPAFRIVLTLFRDCSGIPLGTGNQTITARFAPGLTCTGPVPGTNLNLPGRPQTGGQVEVPCQLEVTPTTCNGGTRYGIERYEYDGIFVVPSTIPDACRKFIFAFDLCCRNTAQNYNGTNGQDFYIESYLDATSAIVPYNSSPRFQRFEIPAFCVGDPAMLIFDGIEPDGDSVVYQFITAKNGPNIPDTLTYSGGFGLPNPISSSSPILINPINANVTFTSNTSQVVIVVIRATEFRNGVLIGSIMQDVQVVTGTGGICANIRPTWRPRQFAVNCGDSVLTLTTQTAFRCSSVSPSGSEFRLTGPDGVVYPAFTANPINCTADTTRSLEVRLFQPFIMNGRFTLRTKTGYDGNTFMNICDRQMLEGDSVNIDVVGCYSFNDAPQIVNVSVDSIDNKSVNVDWIEAPGFDYAFFKSFNLYRRAPSSPAFIPVGTITDPTIRSYKDQAPELNPSKERYDYFINLSYLVTPAVPSVVREVAYGGPKSNYIFNYDDGGKSEDLNMLISWQKYNGWDSTYNLQFATNKDSTKWSSLGIIDTIADADNIIRKTYEKPLEEGGYRLRVFTDSLNFRSYSNWITFNVPSRILDVANVVTPNGDNKNDTWKIDNLRFYPNTKVMIFNRWGIKVFEDGNYQNQWGADAETGTYFYTINVPGEPTPRQGMLSILR